MFNFVILPQQLALFIGLTK